MIVRGNNQELHGNRIGATLDLSGNNAVYSGNLAFTDYDDGTIAEDEVGDAIPCN